MNNYFVILAAGKSKRFNKNIAKQFYNYKNKEIIKTESDRLAKDGYEGDALVKMYKSARYYFKNKNS